MGTAVKCLIVVGMITIVEMGWLPFRSMGFYCQDPKISHRFTGDTVSFKYLLSSTFFMPLLVMCLVEAVCIADSKERKKKTLAGMKLAWGWYAHFAFGLLLLILIIEFAKTVVSEPRPHFLDSCKPDKAINCTTGTYISDYKCTNNVLNHYYVKDSTRSFPSGHSALGYYAAVYLIWFLQLRLSKIQFLIVPWLQCLCILWAVLCSLTRITDNRHHWWDVLIGSLLGVGVAVYVVVTLCKSFHCEAASGKREPSTSEDSVSYTKTSSSRRLLSSTSSYSPPDDKDARIMS